jgi:hypothetical protein
MTVVVTDQVDGSLTVEAVVAGKGDIYLSKRAANRDKDLRALPLFGDIHRPLTKDGVRERYRKGQEIFRRAPKCTAGR